MNHDLERIAQIQKEYDLPPIAKLAMIEYSEYIHRPKTKKQSGKQLAIPNPYGEKWNEYLKSRRQKKHPMTPAALELARKAIQKCIDAGIDEDVVLDKMIESGWRTCKPEWFPETRQSALDKMITNMGGNVITPDFLQIK